MIADPLDPTPPADPPAVPYDFGPHAAQPSGAAKGEIGGDRHYRGGGLPPITSWTCPACAVVQTGPFGTPCANCGAGKAAYKKVDPPRLRREGMSEAQVQRTASVAAASEGTGRAPIGHRVGDTAFETWFAAQYLPTGFADRVRGDVYLWAFLQRVFEAGWLTGRAEGRREMVPPTVPAGPGVGGLRTAPVDARGGQDQPERLTTQTDVLPLDGRLARTLAVALSRFLEEVLAADPEETRTGEWCGADEVRRLIDTLTAISETDPVPEQLTEQFIQPEPKAAVLHDDDIPL